MRKSFFLASILFLACMLLPFCPASAEKEQEAIVIAAFGTSVDSARSSYMNVEKEVRAKFPGKTVLWAWTAHSLLQSDNNEVRLSVQQALAKLATDGVKKASILSLHVIPGAEYNNLAQTARAFEGLPKGLEQVRLSHPLLYDVDSLAEVAKMLVQSAPKERKATEAMVFVGHGTHHAAGVYYPALQYYLHALDKNVFVGTVESSPDLEAVLGNLKANGVRRLWLAPLMTVAGDHAVNDIFGPEKDSWAQSFIAKGIKVERIAKGLGEYPVFVERMVANLVNSMK